jgi:signal transduction histidine kinase
VASDGTIAHLNRACARVFGWDPAAMRGSSLLDRLATSPSEALEYLRHCAGTPHPLPGAVVARTAEDGLIPCRAEGWMIRPRAGDTPALVVLRFFRRDAPGHEFLELTRRIGELNAEIARRRAAEREAETALARVVELQQRLAMLTDATGAILGSLTVDAVLHAIGALMARLLPADAHAVWRYAAAAGAWRVEWQQGLSPTFVREISGWTGSPPAAPFHAPLAVTDVTELPLLADRRAVYSQESIESLMILPLRIEGDNYGTAVAYYRRKRDFTEADLRVATALGNMGSAALTTAGLYEAQSRSREAAELAERRAQFLAAASAALASSLDYRETLRTVGDLAVPEIADWCAVDMVMEDGALSRLAIAHVDPAKVELARQLHERYPPDPGAPRGASRVIRTATPEMMSRIPDDLLRSSVRDAEHYELIRALGLTSYMCVPLVIHGRAIGALTFVSAESGREYSDDDLRFAEDVAFRTALAVENARAYEATRRANELKDAFLATLSHELRTPLNAILGYMRMLTSGQVANERRAKALEVVERNAKALHQMVEDLLDVSRIEAGKIRLNVQAVHLPAIIRDASAAISPAADARGVRLESILEQDPPHVLGDPDRLQQVVWNLLANAVKFTPRGGRVEVRLAHADSHVELVVSDTGAGIAPDFLPQVFERFRQAESGLTREYGGLGLGLAIARHLVEMHGGSITAASDGVGHGSTFCVRLPAIQPAG